MNIYTHSHVQAIKELHDEVLAHRETYTSVFRELEGFVNSLYDGVKRKDPHVTIELNNWHPSHIGKNQKEVLEAPIAKTDCELCIARAYGFDNWTQVESEATNPHNWKLEKAIDLLLEGNLGKLTTTIEKHPELIKSQSQYGHRAGLIHYCGSNGLETWRQVVPQNLPSILEMLLAKGADPNASNNIYGGSNLKDLIKTSAHPFDAGLTESLLEVLALHSSKRKLGT